MWDITRENRSSSNTTLLFSPALDRTLYTDENLLICYLICAMIGIPANLFVTGLIIGSSRLRKPRTFIWLGVGLANILLLCYHVGEFVVVCWPNPEMTSVVDWVIGLPHLNLLVSTLIPVIERHLCLRYPNWHRENVTNKGILSMQIGSLVILCLIVKVRQFYEELCFNLTLSGFLSLLNSVLAGYFLCLPIQLVFKATFSRAYPPASGFRHPPASLLDNRPCVQIEEERVSRMNLEAARSVTMGGLGLLAFSSPAVVFAVVHLNSCLSSTGPTGCIERFQLFAYLVNLSLFTAQ